MPNSIKIKDLWNGEWWLDLFLCREHDFIFQFWIELIYIYLKDELDFDTVTSMYPLLIRNSLTSLGTFLDFGYALPILILAGFFFLAMLFCKNKQEQKEAREADPEPDFLNPTEEEKKD